MLSGINSVVLFWGKVIAEELDPARFSDVSGIYFVLSRTDAETLPDRKEIEEDEENE